MKVVLVGNSRQDLASMMLQAGTYSYNRTHADNPLTVEFVPLEEYAEHQARNADSCLTCITVSEAELSQCRDALSTGREPCPSLAIAQAAIRNDESKRIVLVRSSTSVTGADTAAAVLMGAVGIVDDRGLVSADVLDAVVRHQVNGRRHRSVLLIGEALPRLQKTQDMVREWNEDEEGNDAVDLNSWQACFALAQINRLEPIFGAGGQPYSFIRLADALNLAEGTTGFRLTQNDLRRALSTLAYRLLGPDHEQVVRGRLPDYVRTRGFPSVPPAITGIPHGEIVSRLYHVVQEVEISCQNDLNQLPRGVVRLPDSRFRRYSRRIR